MVDNFNLESEVERLGDKYENLIGQTNIDSKKYLDFNICEEIIDLSKDDLIGGRDHRLREGEQNWGELPHSLYVFENMMDLTFAEKMSMDDTKIGMTTALLHDIGYAVIAKAGEDVSHNFQDMRVAHMEAGAEYVPNFLDKYFKNIFDKTELQKISNIIKIHDNPSVKKPEGGKGYPLDVNDKLLYLHREADRLWMGSSEGFDNDFRGRLESGEKSPAEHIVWLEERYSKEKSIYLDDGKFINGLLFRTPKAYDIHLKNMVAVKKRYNF